MKRLSLIIVCSIILKIAASQTISPLQTDEYCPNTEYTFTATITKPYQSMIGIGSCYVTQLPTSPVGTTFTFKGKFGDANQKQTFEITHTDGTHTDFDFKKIKSLFYSTTGCSPIQPNQTTITAPRCQVSNFNISFNNIQWGTAFESPSLCFGSITTYEYQLPNGWSIGSNVSTGSNWIAGGNNVTITSDLSNGVNGSIQVRAVNNCGTGLYSGQSVSISVLRPAPIISITPVSQDYICSGNASYTINGMPSGSSVQWNLSNTTDASILGCSTCSTVTVSRNTSTNTVITLTATVTHCTPFVYTVTHDVSLGTPPPNPINVDLVDPAVGRIQVDVEPALPGFSSYNWYKNGVLQNIYHGTFAQIPIARNVCDIYYSISVEAINVCGTSAQTYKDVYVPSCGSSFMVSPNPATSDVTVSTIKSKTQSSINNTFDEVRVYDFQGTFKKYQKFNNVKTANINISGLPNGNYFIEISSGIYKERHQLLIQK